MLMSLYDEYESYVKKYKAEYGNNTVILYRCGQFYEMYSANDGLIDIKSVSELLNIQLSRRNKAILDVDRTNTLMAGFPMFALRKFVDILVKSNYTVVIVDQITPPPKPKRGVTEIISPGTNIDYVNIHETNNLASIYIDEQKDNISNKLLYAIGISIIDLSTGKSKVSEAYSHNQDTTNAFDEIYRILSIHCPKEIVLFGNIHNISYDDICIKFNINNVYIHNKLNIYPNEICLISYQTKLLQKVFPNHGMMSVIEYLDMEKMPYAVISYIYLLQFAMKHNEDILSDIQKPILIEKTKYCNLQYNAAKQLNILPSNDSKQSLLHILNNCITAIGKRMFKDILLYPLIDTIEIEKRYNIIETFLESKKFIDIQRILGNTYDIERLHRKMTLGKFQPADFMQIHETIESLCTIFKYYRNDICKSFEKYQETFCGKLLEIQNHYMSVFIMEEISKYHLDNVNNSFLKKGIDNDIDELQKDLNEQYEIIQNILVSLNQNGYDGYFKLESNDRDGHYLLITQKRFNDIKTILNNKHFNINESITFSCKDMTSSSVSSSSSNLKIKHPILTKISELIVNIQTKLRGYITEFFKKYVKEFIHMFNSDFYVIAECIGNIDVYTNHASNAYNFRYFRPKITNNKQESYIDIKNVRHPIIERIQTELEYVTNDVILNNDVCGMLLFGLNCSGKTSLSKAIALNVIMAQCGSFVPSNMQYYPFHNIFTRIPSGDDIFKGMSTFAVEMSELRNILKRADEYSCIVGDEISHGTEVISGVSIVSSALIELTKRKSKFIFATHLHTITNVPQISSLTSITMKHLQVHYDTENDILVYDRKLKDGPGSSIYGLEVCKSLDMPKEFLMMANSIRQQQIGVDTSIVSFQKSRYNNGVFYDTCSICSKKCQEIHHIKHQSSADDEGFINYVHKNVKSNLIGVCSSCHDDIHASKITINGYIQTSNGIVLQWEYNQQTNNDIERNIENQIIEMRQKGISIHNISSKLNITEYRVRKIMRKYSSK